MTVLSVVYDVLYHCIVDNEHTRMYGVSTSALAQCHTAIARSPPPKPASKSAAKAGMM